MKSTLFTKFQVYSTINYMHILIFQSYMAENISIEQQLLIFPSLQLLATNILLSEAFFLGYHWSLNCKKSQKLKIKKQTRMLFCLYVTGSSAAFHTEDEAFHLETFCLLVFFYIPLPFSISNMDSHPSAKTVNAGGFTKPSGLLTSTLSSLGGYISSSFCYSTCSSLL